MTPLTPVEFAAAVATLKLGEVGAEAARRVLVCGETASQVADAVNESKQMVSYWTGRVRKVHEAQVKALDEASPPGWQARVLALPADEMQQVENRSKTALYALSLQQAKE